MALLGGGDQSLNIIVRLKDEASKQLDQFKGKVENMQPAFKKMAAIGTAAFVGIAAVAYKSVQAYAEVERAQRQLEHAVIGVSKGTAEQVKQIEAVATALEKKAGVDADSLKMGAAQLSTFGLQSASVVKLTKSLADLTVNQSGLNATADDYVGSANTIAKALNGQFGILEKSGIRFTEAQQKLIQFGTESEKVAALQEGFAQNLRETTDTVGGVDLAMAKLNRTTENIKENLGKALAPAFAKLAEKLQPIIERFAEWAEKNPELLAKIILIAGAVAGLVAVVGFLGLALPAIITGFTLLLGPIGLIILAVAALVTGIVLLVRNWDSLKEKAIEVWEGIKTAVNDAIQSVKDKASEIWNSITTFTQTVWEGIKNVIETAIALIVGIITMFLDWIVPGWDTALLAVWEKWTAIWTQITEFGAQVFQAISDAINLFVEKIKSIVSVGLGFIKTIWTTVWSGISSFFIALWEPVRAAIKGVIDFVVAQIQKAIDLYERLKALLSAPLKAVGNAANSVGNSVSSFFNSAIQKGSDLLGFETGGTVPGARGTAVPILAHGGETIIPAGQSQGSGGVNITLQLNYPSFKSQEDVSVVRDQIERALRDVVRVYKLQPN